MELNPDLLFSEEHIYSDLESSLNGTNTKGSYHPMQYVVRLRKDIHKALQDEEQTPERIQAFSTYMHETIHWWQHVGSHLGFLTSLSYPALAHRAHKDLTAMIARNEKFKSIVQYDKQYYKQTGNIDNPEVNSILNYYYDLLYGKYFILDNSHINAILTDKRFFLNIGHCFHILWSSSIHTLSLSIDKEYTFLPNVEKWSDNFSQMEKDKKQGFYIDSPVTVSPLGTKAIYEGQARFNQLQYLTIAFENKYGYEDFKKLGMLHGIYIQAFDLFLDITGIQRPNNFNNSIIGLFLLICDISINPVDGFPFDIYHYETFIISNDPGMRFTLICQAVKKDKQRWADAVKDYSRDEYVVLSEELCKELVCFAPLYGSAEVVNWSKKHESVKQLLKEEAEMDFDSDNMEIRLFASKYIRFQQDKIKYPSIFCWTGKCMTEEADKELNLELVEQIFNKHQALFVDDCDGIIKPIIFENCTEENIHKTFQMFYALTTMHDMIMKWIKESGEFNFDYTWLTTEHSDAEMKSWIRENFKKVFNIYPEDLAVV